MKRIILAGLAAALLVSLSCIIFDEIDYPVIIELMEVPGEPITLYLQCHASDWTDNRVGPIKYKLEEEEDGFTVKFLGTRDTIGEEGLESADIDLGRLEEGEYRLTFKNRRSFKEEEWTLHVEDSVIWLEGDTAGVTRWPDGIELRRIFPDMLLVSAGYNDSQYPHENVDSLFASLEEIGAIDLLLPEGSYSVFSINYEGAVTGRIFEDYGTASKIFSYTEQIETLDSLVLEIFKEQKVGALEVYLLSGAYHVWVEEP